MERPQRRQKRALEIMRIVINETVKVQYVVKQVIEAQKTQLEQQKLVLHVQSLQESWQKLLQELHDAIIYFQVNAMSNLKDHMGEFQAVRKVLYTTQTIPLPIETTDIQMQCYLIEVQEQIQTKLRQCVKQLPEIVPPELVLLVEQQKKNEVVDLFLNDVQCLHAQMQTEMQKIQKILEEGQKELEKEQKKIEQEPQTHTKCRKEHVQWIQEQIKVVQRQAKMAERRQWDEYYMKIACLAARRSKDPSTPVS